VNRRDLLGAFLGGLIAALVLPFEDFVRWWKGLAESPRGVVTLLNVADIVNFEAGEQYVLSDGIGSSSSLRITGIDHFAGTITVSA
jgi:hypothetical protein